MHIPKIAELTSDALRAEFSRSAIEEMVRRINQGDHESAASIGQACLIGLRFGTSSAELKSHWIIESARLAVLS